jgi:sugar phosphate isomerase/epimerase
MLARRIAFAETLGASVLITNAGPAAARETILRRLEAALPTLERAGLTLALENPGHGRGDLIGRGEEGAALVASLAAPLLRLNLDVGNLLTYAGSLEPGLSEALPFAAHAHLKEIAEHGADWRFVPLGEGLLDWKAVADAIQRSAPNLPVAIELPLRLRRPARSGPVRAEAAVPLPVIRDALHRSMEVWTAAIG